MMLSANFEKILFFSGFSHIIPFPQVFGFIITVNLSVMKQKEFII